MRARRALAVALLGAALAAAGGGPAGAASAQTPAPATPPAGAAPSREQALDVLGRAAGVEARRSAVSTLAERGIMDDLPVLVRTLRDPDALVRALSERALWQVWSRSGDEETDRLLAIGIEQMAARDSEAAVETFTRVIERRPQFAEGWNKRATTYYLLGDYARSLADCDEVMKRNPYHYGALSGYGMIYLQLGEPEKALAWFERALAVNPNLPQVEQTVEMLRRLLIQRRRDST
jgi:tetratricopeptide (TPR) repeat protein